MFVPSKTILQMEVDLQRLPRWWAEDGDAILIRVPAGSDGCDTIYKDCAVVCADARDNEFTPYIYNRYSELHDATGHDYQPMPWGWSRSVRERLRRFGMDSDALPSDDWLHDYRTLASREFGCQFMRAVLAEAAGSTLKDRLVGEEMRFFTDFESVMRHTSDTSKDYILKSPWSSSGRGITVSKSGMSEKAATMAKATINAQGGVLVDRFYRKTMDLALEYYVSPNGGTDFIGYSIFQATADGKYCHNLLKSNAELRGIIDNALGDSSLTDFVIDIHKRLLTRLLGGRYSGFLGIDMLLAEDGGALKVHPCIEMNLRMNMGIAALNIQQRLRDRITAPDKLLIAGKESGGFGAFIDGENFSITYNKPRSK